MGVNLPFADKLSNATYRLAGKVSSKLGLPAPLDPNQPQRPQPELPYETDLGFGHPTRTYIDPITNLKLTQSKGADTIPEDYTIYDIYRERAERMGDSPLFVFKRHGSWISKTAHQVLADIRRTAKGMMHIGIKKGTGVAFMCSTSYEWDVVDAAVVSIGGVLATIYDTDSAPQVEHILDNSDAQILIVQTNAMRERIEDALEHYKNVKVYCLEQGDLEAIQAYGETVSDRELDERIASIKKTDLCSIVYTSGSTALPKGVEMTHECFCATAKNLRAFMPDLLADPRNSELQFLPQAHSFARAINYIVVNSDITEYISESFATLLSDLQYARPTIMIGVPRVFEKIYNAASQKAGSGLQGYVFQGAVNVATTYSHEMSEQGKVNRSVRLMRGVFNPVVYKTLRDALGGRAKWLVCGGAPLDPRLMNFFRGAGIPLFEGYGMTETTAPCAFTPLTAEYREGSVGIAFPGFTLRVAETGELQVKGAAAFTTYHKNSKATKESFTKDGWLKTGDLGRIDNDGYVYITGRIKDLIITAGGKNVTPGPMEEKIARSPLVSHALVLGDKRPFVSALVTLDPDGVKRWLKSHGMDENMSLEEAANNAAVRSEIQQYVDKANEGESRAESVRKFIILPDDFTQQNGLLTASMKVIRPKVLKRYEDLLNTQMYVPLNKH